ncbi:RNA polymerase sigma factor [Exiguobacterium algae]|uniref:RNA polymerase sigma factor n=1 Tax=Exiguobacterium algae TaxID=2751250 RepID=UPI001BE5CAB7|nr:RNA polymerase sigma factor [Exiguobacterium algae]
MDDQVIIDWYWQRSEYAIVATKRKYGRYCQTISYNILHNREDAEECVNDTYMKVWEAIPPTRPRRLGAFLAKVVRNLSLNRYELYHAKKRGVGDVPLVYEELENVLTSSSHNDEDIVEILNDFLMTLPEQTRRVFMQRYFHFYSIKEIAKMNRMGESNVKMILMRTRTQLKQVLESEGVAL